MSTSKSSGAKRRRNRDDTFQLIALGLALLASLLLLVVPAFGGTSASSETGGVEVQQTSTLLESQGTGVLVILLLPLVLTLLPLLVPGRGRGRRAAAVLCTLLLGLGALAGLLSIGAFYLPALVFAIAAATATVREPVSR